MHIRLIANKDFLFIVFKYILFYDIQVLNETSLWWFNKTEHITPNAVVCAPDENVTIAKKCTVFPVEFVGKILWAYSFLFILIMSYVIYAVKVIKLSSKFVIPIKNNTPGLRCYTIKSHYLSW